MAYELRRRDESPHADIQRRVKELADEIQRDYAPTISSTWSGS